MEDSFYTSQESVEKTKNASFVEKIGPFVGITFPVFILVGVAYYLGRQSQKPYSETLYSDQSLTSSPSVPPNSPTLISKIFVSPSVRPSPTISSRPSPTPMTKTKIITSIPELDGFRSSSGAGNQSSEIRVGRNINLVTRGFVSFSLNDLPSGINIEEANLRLYQTKVIGNPYSAGGGLKVDHLTYGNSLDDTDYGMAALVSNLATIATSNVIGWKDTDITMAVRNDVENGRSQSQFRIHFTTENTGGTLIGDFAYFEAAEDSQGTGYTPQLVIKYY
ncbi:hypothetical protein A2962_00820 [Candidatus Woesebacteria bacterium RIFCSPLOWO2_01_FULL_39_61]|uniref:TGF-beta propeptide domain-containing protein n=1 Tax=Candidatus Woesebacteria bacterium RIFCSPHIGHO2_02_FULL_39_13 TaxID=1802505 RepID=A0A1F7Z664_9BACT|nr:MAG: hypothetical protein A2692_02935 [Candidatus Woesebacteria bacterium RIFCSPHIGHO2_01_FULL_39_95]OGM34418.1 MAG: hypothetical protein A3D01_05600 [Candidatus Woesebacteria bacterium RIFCSPHIGHO2_02_FULL_39_13]OGM36235.1 MAG: hypothetical protein A3E13_02760 [Candidatus Woesebacteria bacterium RIFCSPHIGHO2_12_FULL_40_20]OGM68283.1 MAG: hypothetical protein A2962_00820 [Candidatus Woesebacteria bacterium RIFCSPLOWO2_01_FULL_39_61]OGM74221.1 MAG: hypothetical protein A3H19_05485 [Candidatus